MAGGARAGEARQAGVVGPHTLPARRTGGHRAPEASGTHRACVGILGTELATVDNVSLHR